MPVEVISWFPNRSVAFSFVIVFFLWAASEVANTVGSRLVRPRTSRQRNDRGSYWIILLVVWGSLTVSVWTRTLNLGVFHNRLQYLGLGLITIGIALREWAVLSLGRFFTVTVTVASDHRLIKRGPYRWLRHPAYSGNILTLVGMPLALGTWVGSVLVVVLSAVGYLYRIRIEEQALLEVFGDDYRAYTRQTWRLFPGL